MTNNPLPPYTPIPAPYPPKDHWDYNLYKFLDQNFREMLGRVPGITTPSYWADWSRAFFYAGTTLYLWNEAIELKVAFLSACSLQEGQTVFLIGKYAAESGLAPALRSLVGERGRMTAEEIGPESVGAYYKIDSTPGTKLQWNFDYLDSLPDQSLDRVVLFGAASHVANWDHLAQQINRVLKDGGRVVIAEAPLGGKEFRYALHLDAHYEGFLLRILSGMGIKEEDLPDVGADDLTALFQPSLRWSRSFSWEGIYLFYGQKGGQQDVSSFEFPKSNQDVQAFLTVKPSEDSWDFLAEPERAAWGKVVSEIKQKDLLNVLVWGCGNLIWEWHNSRSITDIMWSNLTVKPGDKILAICEIPNELGTMPELEKRVGETGEIVWVNMCEGEYDGKGWQKKRQEYLDRGCGEEWEYEFADDYPDSYFDLVFLPQGVHHSNNWLRDAPRLLRTLKPGHQFMAIECGINRPEFAAAREKSALLRVVGDRLFDLVFPPNWNLSTKGPVPLKPGCERVGRPAHDVSTAHLGEAFGNSLTDVHNIEWKGWILFWGFKK